MVLGPSQIAINQAQLRLKIFSIRILVQVIYRVLILNFNSLKFKIDENHQTAYPF